MTRPRSHLLDHFIAQAKADEQGDGSRRSAGTADRIALLPETPPGPRECADGCPYCHGSRAGFGDWWGVGA